MGLTPSERLHTNFGGHKAVARPDPIPNSAVKRSLADGSACIACARVGCRQIFQKAETAKSVSALFCTDSTLATLSRPTQIHGMGMRGNFVSVSDMDLEAIFEEPSRLQKIHDMGWDVKMSELGPEGQQQYEQTLKQMEELAGRRGVSDEIKKAFQSLRDSRQNKGAGWQPQEKPGFLDLDKAWHGIHFLLTGNNFETSGHRLFSKFFRKRKNVSYNPLAFILEGGRELPSEDFGYGPPRAFSPDEVQDINRALSQVNEQELYDRADPSEFSARQIYPDIWDDEPKEESIGYLTHYLKELKTFVKRTAESNGALIAYIS